MHEEQILEEAMQEEEIHKMRVQEWKHEQARIDFLHDECEQIDLEVLRRQDEFMHQDDSYGEEANNLQ